MKPFSLAYKKKMVERMTARDAVSARALSRETGVTQTTLSRWKVRILSETKDLTGRELAAYLEREIVLLAQLEQWRLALEEEGVAPKVVAKRIQALERELARKLGEAQAAGARLHAACAVIGLSARTVERWRSHGQESAMSVLAPRGQVGVGSTVARRRAGAKKCIDVGDTRPCGQGGTLALEGDVSHDREEEDR